MNLVIKTLFALSLVGSLAAYSQGKSGDLKVQPQVNQSNTEVTMSDNNPFAKEQKPWLQAEIQSNYALFYLYINGIRVYGNETPSAATNITLPINKYLKKGENSIKITMLTPPEKWAQDAVRLGKTSEVSIQIQVGPFDKSRQNYNLNKLNFTASPDSYSSDTTELGDTTKQVEWFFDAKSAEFVTAKSDQTPLVMVSQPQIEAGKVFNQYQGQPENIYKMAKGVAISQDINLPLPFPEWAWMRADKLTESKDEIRHQLYDTYQKIWQAVENKNVEILAPLFTEVDKDRTIWSYGNIPEGSILDGINKKANDSNLKLFKMSEDDYNVVIYDGRVACLMNGADGEALAFNAVNGSGSNNTPLCFGKINGQWKVVL